MAPNVLLETVEVEYEVARQHNLHKDDEKKAFLRNPTSHRILLSCETIDFFENDEVGFVVAVETWNVLAVPLDADILLLDRD
jgi:hypothetical protein